MEDIQLIEHQRHSRELGYKPDAIRQGVDVIDETDSCDKGDGYQKPDVLEAKEGRPDPKPQDENYSTTSEHYTAVRGTLVRFVTNSAARSRAVIIKYVSQVVISLFV